ncbi:MAG: mechanosensitive ion channel family protein [Isosphaeraceae bacterium]
MVKDRMTGSPAAVSHARFSGLTLLALAIVGPCGGRAWAEPPVPKPPTTALSALAKGGSTEKEKEEKEKEKGSTPTKEGAKVATAPGPIKVDNPVEDSRVEATLESLLPRYPGVHSVDATVSEGVVALDGEVDDDETRNQMTEVSKQVEGVRLVINRLATDAEALTAPQLVLLKLWAIWDVVSRRWLLAFLALAILLIFSGLARLVNDHAETILAPFLKNVMLRSVIGSLLGSLLIIGGLMFGLSVLNMTHAVLSILGLAGVVGLAVGFAFKDIAENFIASVLLGMRRPFQIGDHVTVAGQSGVVRSLNTRATVLVTLEGHHVRIPNNIIYKEILVNATVSPSIRASFDVVIPHEASTTASTEAMTTVLRELRGVMSDPAPCVLVEALEPSGVRLRAYYWACVKDMDLFKLNSEARLRVKVALQEVGAFAPPSAFEHDDAHASRNSHVDVPPTPSASPVLPDESKAHVREEGTNMLVEAR